MQNIKDVPSGETRVSKAEIGTLTQIESLVETVSDELFTKEDGGATIGKHLRHTLDHFGALLDGEMNDAEIAYDRRERGGSVESDRGEALKRATSLRERLESMDDVQLSWPVKISVMVCADEDEVQMESTVCRELAFVCHHAMHHLAMIKTIATNAGVELPAEFGRAPSTVSHDRNC
ncbi:MAG: DinB family protein [Planctomycetota bacterium]